MIRKLSTALALTLLFPMTASAHKMWLLPSETVLSGPNPVITVDGAISNDLFYFNHVPMPLRDLAVTAPDGSKIAAENQATLRYRSVFDLSLPQKGTYRIAVPMSGLFATWEEKGEGKMWRGTVAELAGKVPADASKLQVTESAVRVETFVTNGNPTNPVLETTGKGIELIPITHPNDLFAGEAGRFKLLVDGKPAAGLNVEVIRGGTRYRNSPQEIHVTTNADGEISVSFAEPGMYWLETTQTDDKTQVPQAGQRRLTYAATLEVLPR